jgi:hypothetical protein
MTYHFYIELEDSKENLLYQEIAEKIFVKRMKALMLDANGLFNKDVLDADFFTYALNFIRTKQKENVDTVHYETTIKYLKRWISFETAGFWPTTLARNG